MTRFLSRRLAVSTAALALVLGITGCGGGPDSETVLKDANKNNGERLANAYSFYQQNNNGEGPKDVESFKTYIENDIDPALKKTMGIPSGSLDELFVSERDGQPFFIRPEAPLPTTGGLKQAVVIESQGVGGTIQVFYTGPSMVEVPAADVEAYKSGEKDIVPGPPGLNQ